MKTLEMWQISRADKTRRCGSCLLVLRKNDGVKYKEFRNMRFPLVHRECLKKLHLLE
jgi:hypothetical protein